MIDLKAFERDPEGFKKRLERRGEVHGLAALHKQLKERKALITETQTLQEARNQASKALSGASKSEIDSKRAELKDLGQKIKDLEHRLKKVEEVLQDLLLRIPNPPQDDVPSGLSEADNVEIRKVGEPRQFDFPVLDHMELGHRLDWIDAARAVKMSGSRFSFLKGEASRINRALIQYFCDFHVRLGDVELTPPYLVKGDAMVGTGQFPNFKEDVFEVFRPEAEPLYLIPTSEVSVTNYHADEILEETQLPLRYMAYSACFRSEAGAAGKDTKGLIRLHQFEKVELVRFCTKEQAESELEAMLQRDSTLLTALELPHRVVVLCTGDIGFHSQKTYDIEVWLPAQNTYREISSCSVFGDFQARRAQIRYRSTADKSIHPVWTLNGSALPLGRTLVAILENHQQADGSIRIPKVLKPYLSSI